MKRRDVPGTVYVLHFEPPYRHAAHYTGWTERELDARLATHLSGRGARLVEVAHAAGCRILVACTMPGTRSEERRLKQRGNAARICTICRKAHGLGPYQPRRPTTTERTA